MFSQTVFKHFFMYIKKMLLIAFLTVFQSVASNNFPNVFKNCFQNKLSKHCIQINFLFLKEHFLWEAVVVKIFFTISKSSRTLSTCVSHIIFPKQNILQNYPPRLLIVDIVILVLARFYSWGWAHYRFISSQRRMCELHEPLSRST